MGSRPSELYRDAPRDALGPTGLDRLQDNYVFITHSLGSRITTDALQSLAAAANKVPEFREKAQALRNKRFALAMLSNQVPLLQLGQPEPEVRGQIDDICGPGAPKAEERLFQETKILAFSDPNDLFRYAIPPKFLSPRSFLTSTWTRAYVRP
ncbi:MAG: hypothetical protein P1P84_01420 [Deferrisomatales bacterium]|nr:hypothetical protein [Deferrisomatales bacterium]